MNRKVAVIGLGYVGLPLALSFGRVRGTLGYDRDSRKVAAYREGRDPTGEVDGPEFASAKHLSLTDDPRDLKEAGDVIVAVPTPVDDAHQPDFGPLLSACEAIGPHLAEGATVIFESTVYPGATEEVCVPALERNSGKKWKKDFFVGYSPERINPGDKEHTFERIVKVVAGDTPETLERVAALYASVVTAGVYKAATIKVAEAAKVIENTQRDLNIALMNELSIIFHRLGIDTRQVLDAAGTKWNFLKFVPGLVGGHCIGVDPYYLTHRAEKAGYHPEVILAGRRINDGMGAYIAGQTVKCLAGRGRPVAGATIAVLGLTFKENCADIRNSKVVDIIRELKEYGVKVLVHDPRAEADDARHEYGLDLCTWEDLAGVDALVLAVAHKEFTDRPLAELLAIVAPGGCVVDVKSVLDPATVKARGLGLWRL